MKLQSFSNFALNNKELNATKGGKRVTTSAAIQQMITAAVASGAQAKTASNTTIASTNCSVSKTTMVGSICIEWKNGPGCTSTTPTTPSTGA